MLTSRPGGEVQTAINNPPATEVPTAFQQMQQQPLMPGRLPNFRNGAPVPSSPQPAAAEDDSADDDSADDKDDDSDEAQPQQPGQMVQPTMGQQPDNSQDQGNPPNGGPRTPEQILQMIRDGQRPGPPGVPPNQQPPQE